MRFVPAMIIAWTIALPVLGQDYSPPASLLRLEDATKSRTLSGGAFERAFQSDEISSAQVNGTSDFPNDEPLVGPGGGLERAAAILREATDMLPGEYSAEKKLLEIAQLERIQALRDSAQENATLELTAQTDGSLVDDTQRAVALRTSIWPSPTIRVWWENATTANAQERDWIRDAVRQTWESSSAVRFVGWQQVPRNGNARGIRIRLRDEGPHCKRLGRFLDGLPDGMVLNITFRNWSQSALNNPGREKAIRWVAVHEFGHALGFAHEQNRSDAPGWCRERRQGSDGDWFVTIYDPQSIMNYCSSEWNNAGRLTALDRRAIAVMYGARAPSVAGETPMSYPSRKAASSSYESDPDDVNKQDSFPGDRSDLDTDESESGKRVSPIGYMHSQSGVTYPKNESDTSHHRCSCGEAEPTRSGCDSGWAATLGGRSP